MMGAIDTRNMQSNFAVNKYLHTVASCWILLTYTFFVSVNCFTCFGWYIHPSSGAHTTVSTASGTCQIVTATCRCRGRDPTLPRQQQVAVTIRQVPDDVDTVVFDPDDGWRYLPKHVEQFTDINKLCNVASCWISIGIQAERFRFECCRKCLGLRGTT